MAFHKSGIKAYNLTQSWNFRSSMTSLFSLVFCNWIVDNIFLFLEAVLITRVRLTVEDTLRKARGVIIPKGLVYESYKIDFPIIPTVF